ncbi:MAG: 6-phosphofructokinase [Gammaproteobacteria bacterium RIFCSPHIGHO2_12_FULL_41_15]|nr:MAG: 6-phosphofructokinase [Gammaproteobacteria bacterium RIFCSPHIGHO2_12_FULL_41_15]
MDFKGKSVVNNNIFYAQSGGPTAVINATACGVIQTARQKNEIGTVFAGKNGIIGALKNELIDTAQYSDTAIEQLKYTPASAFGTCRYKLKSLEEDRATYEQLIQIFKNYQIGYVFYNGGNDSQDTSHKLSKLSKEMGYPLSCLGLPKTVDNDLFGTDCCPGFGSVAKYIAISTLETALDVKSMSASSTKVFILEVMGRHAGWIAASAGLAGNNLESAPHIILLPEVPFEQKSFLIKVKQCVKDYGYCSIVASEGTRFANGKFLSEGTSSDAFGHVQLGGVAPILGALINKELSIKNHWAVADYLQRSARHLASQVDLDQAYTLGQQAVLRALNGASDVMLTIDRIQQSPYQWQIGEIALSEVANKEKKLPTDFIRADGFGISEKCRDYLLPLIQGEAYPTYHNGLPEYVKLNLETMKSAV